MIRDSSLVSGLYEIHRKYRVQRTLINCEAQYVLHLYRIRLVESIYVKNIFVSIHREKYMERGTRYEHLVQIGEEGIDNFHRDRSTL